MDDDFSIAMRLELMTKPYQLGHRLAVIVDFTVEDDPDIASLVIEWLLAASDINDRQPAMTQPDARLQQEAIAVGSAMGDGIVHRGQHAGIDRPRALGVEY